MAKLRAAVVGLGQIGMGYDYADSSKEKIFTHASAFQLHHDYELVAGVDPESKNCEKFTKKFSLPAYKTVAELKSAGKLDVIALATPTATHPEVFREILALNPKAILCEKPLAYSIDDARQMVKSASDKACLLAVNYMRRFDPGVHMLKKALEAGQLGEPFKGFVWYTKGIYNNASHYVDLLQFLFGNPTEAKLLREVRKWGGVDPEVDFMLRFANGLEMYFLVGREEAFSLAEMEILGTKGRLRYSEGGQRIELNGIGPDPDTPGYTVLTGAPHQIPSGLMRFQWHVADHLARALSGAGDKLPSSGDSALATLETVAKVRKL